MGVNVKVSGGIYRNTTQNRNVRREYYRGTTGFFSFFFLNVARIFPENKISRFFWNFEKTTIPHSKSENLTNEVFALMWIWSIRISSQHVHLIYFYIVVDRKASNILAINRQHNCLFLFQWFMQIRAELGEKFSLRQYPSVIFKIYIYIQRGECDVLNNINPISKIWVLLSTKASRKRTCSSQMSDYSPFSELTHEQFLFWLDSRHQRAYLGVNITTASLLFAAES